MAIAGKERINFKKAVFNFLCQPVVGKVIYAVFDGKIPTLRNLGYTFFAPIEYSNYSIHASIFWGFYESAEIRLVNKYLDGDLDVIELGGSLGIISSFIVGKLKRGSLFTIVEANPFLISTIHKNTSRRNINQVTVTIVNKAIGYSDHCVYMHISRNNTASHVVNNGSPEATKVDCIELRNIVPEKPYALVCDIEGGEAELIIADKQAFRNCKQLFIEVHETRYKNHNYSREELLEIFVEIGFRLVERDGNVLYMERA